MSRSALFLLGLIVVALLAFAVYQTRYSNTEIRAALDIGSGATNLKIAKVDRDTNQIISHIFEQSIPVAYQKHLEKSGNQTFDPEIMQQGIKAIKVLKETADSYHVKKIVAVATAAFRSAKNAPEFVQEIQKQTGVKVYIIDQDQEGILAFRAAVSVTGNKPESSVVWDVGGGSVQLTTVQDPSGHYLVEKGTLASIPFKNALIEQIQGKDLQQSHSPNPVNERDMEQGIQYIQRNITQGNPYITQKIRQPDTHILAVGNLFNYGVKPVAGGSDLVTQENLEKGLMQLLNKTDQELPGGSLVEVTVSNPLMILGYMKAWGIKEMTVVNVNNADGALTYPPYWQNNQ